jgi:hypothetical protein
LRPVDIGRGLVLDSSHRITQEFAHWLLHDCGVRVLAVMRYVPIRRRVYDEPPEGWPCFLSKRELAELHEVGMPVGIVQEFRGHRMLHRDHGLAAGSAAVWNAQQLDYPPEACVFGDFEWGTERSRQADQPAYIDGWSHGAREQGPAQVLGAYIGSNTGLTGAELGALPHITRYWRSLSIVPTVYRRGPVLSQSWEHVLVGDGPDSELRPWRLVPRHKDNEDDGPVYDLNMSAYDSRGGCLTCVEA